MHVKFLNCRRVLVAGNIGRQVARGRRDLLWGQDGDRGRRGLEIYEREFWDILKNVDFPQYRRSDGALLGRALRCVVRLVRRSAGGRRRGLR